TLRLRTPGHGIAFQAAPDLAMHEGGGVNLRPCIYRRRGASATRRRRASQEGGECPRITRFEQDAEIPGLTDEPQGWGGFDAHWSPGLPPPAHLDARHRMHLPARTPPPIPMGSTRATKPVTRTPRPSRAVISVSCARV